MLSSVKPLLFVLRSSPEVRHFIHTVQITGLKLALEVVRLHDRDNNDNGPTVYKLLRKPVLLQKNRTPDFLQIYVNELE